MAQRIKNAAANLCLSGIFVFILILIYPVSGFGYISQPYVVDEKDQVLFGDSAQVGNYQGLQNYEYNYVNEYLHITFTYTHGYGSYASYPPFLYVTAIDPTTTDNPNVKSSQLYNLGSSLPTDWYRYDIQFDESGFTTIVKRAGETERANFHTSISGLAATDFVALANLYPLSNGVPNAHSMSFTPRPLKGGSMGCTESCFSNVLFLPGIKGSVLKDDSGTIWPPAPVSNDISKLAIDTNGNSVNDVYTDGIVNNYSILNGSINKEIYSPFSNFMDDLVSDGVINEWLPMAYDWRFSPHKIIEDGVKTNSGVVDVIQKVKDLSASSRDGKVTIVAHSMGGLLGKAIIKELQEEGKDDLINSFVMVGTPQLGTPQAIGGLLHGDEESVIAGFLASAVDMRYVAQNMQSAYDLLPSPKYFDEVSDPVITFDPNSSFTETWRNYWGVFIDNYPGMEEFLTGEGVLRDDPDKLVLRKPEILRADLISSAKNFHSEFDNYQLPDHIRVVQVAGWGVPTIKAISYENAHLMQGYDVDFTIEGDKTVIYPSSLSSSGESFFFNILDYRKEANVDTSHKDLLSAEPTQNVIELVIKEQSVVGNSFISGTRPEVSNLDDQLVISTHSPVLLGVYDQEGNFTGINPNQNLSQDLLYVEEEIPGSTFVYNNESQYIFLPKEGEYDFVYRGTGEGPTTVEIGNFSNDDIVPITSFIDIPTTDNALAEFTVNSESPENTIIKVDSNNDGTFDFTLPYVFSGFLEPINDTGHQAGVDLSVFKAGSTVPVKFQLKNSNGEIIQSNQAPTWVSPQKGSMMSESIDESVYTTAASTGTTYRWDSVTQQYIYNWNTKGLQGGYWYKIFAKLDDGHIYSVTIGIR